MRLGKPACNDLQPFAEIDRLIHEPARLMILSYLYVVESADFVFLIRQTGLTWGNLSSHISKLASAGYVEVEKEFVDKKPHSMLRLITQGHTAFRNYFRRMKQLLDYLPN